MAMLEKVLNGRGILSNIGIFASSLLVTVIAVYFYSPVIGSHADEARMSVATTVNPIISLSLDTSLVSFDLTPGDGATFSSLPINAVVDTNSTAGYDLFFSSIDNSTDMSQTGGVAGKTIKSITGLNTIPDNMSVDSWGYSLDGARYSAIPLVDAPATIRTINQYPSSSERTTTVNIGVKVSRTLPSGSYEKDIVFSAVAHPMVKTIHDISTMQEMTSTICANTKTPLYTATAIDWDGSHSNDENYVQRVRLRDTRDNNYYLVSKLADGRCWMSQNLALDLTANTPIIASNTDGTTMSVTPDGTTVTAANISNWGTSNWNSYHPSADESYYQAGNVKASSPSGSGIEYDWEKAGNYYNWYAATAGTSVDVVDGESATASICPEGWIIPLNSGSTWSYKNLFSTYRITGYSETYGTKVRMDPLNYVLAGSYSGSGSGLSDQETEGYYRINLTNTSYSWIYYTLLGMNRVNPGNSGPNQSQGYSIRCVAI